MDKYDFRLNEAQNQYELETGGHTAFLEFFKEGNKVFLNHTEAPEALRGKGAAKKLVELSLKHARDNGLTVVPSCSYVAHFIDNNPEYLDVVSDGYQM